MFLYYQLLEPDCEAELMGEYNTMDQVMERLKKECDDGHEECPTFTPCYDEYISGNFDAYDSDDEHTLYIPSDEEVNELDEDGNINIIKSYIDGDEFAYFVTKYCL